MSLTSYIIRVNPNLVDPPLVLFGGAEGIVGNQILFSVVDAISQNPEDDIFGYDTYFDGFTDYMYEFFLEDNRYKQNPDYFIQKMMDVIKPILLSWKPILASVLTPEQMNSMTFRSYKAGFGHLYIDIVEPIPAQM